MDNLSVIDRFTDTFSRYIDSGFGLVGGEVAFLSATLIAIDVTLAGLFWAFSPGNDEVIAKLIKKVLYVGAFAFIIGNFNGLAGIIFRSFAGLGLTASGSGMSQETFLRPGALAAVGADAGRPILAQIGDLTGFTSFFFNIDTIVVLFLAWLIVIVSFFVLAVQLFVTLLEFKLTTLAGFVLVPFALWNKTAFLAERVLGNVVSSGIKVLVLAVIVGIGSGLFAEFRAAAGSEPSIDHALAIMLASLAMLGLGIFGPSIASGLVSGAPQLGAGAAAGTTLAAGGLAVAGGAAAMTVARIGGAGISVGVRAASSMTGSARAAPETGPAPSAAGVPSAGSSVAGASQTASSPAGVRADAEPYRGDNIETGATSGMRSTGPAVGDSAASASSAGAVGTPSSQTDATPGWAGRTQRALQGHFTHAATTAAHTLRAGDHGGSGANPSLKQED